jgi:hypothetical protein
VTFKEIIASLQRAADFVTTDDAETVWWAIDYLLANEDDVREALGENDADTGP